MARNNRTASFERSLQRGDFDLQDRDRSFIVNETFYFEFSQFSRTDLCFSARLRDGKTNAFKVETLKRDQVDCHTTLLQRSYNSLEDGQIFRRVFCDTFAHLRV